ncbi:MAG TPA: LON peptidase substrate-binding domain-containing protein [Frankiaceae bacterium]|nr:LON peptidase substrate-binding domain-containing protein [Frankiaceae bacterium]
MTDPTGEDEGDAAPETEALPLFPLSAVLFPGAPLPLQIFEERYRTLVRDLLELEPEQRRFGVVAIEAGSEAGMALPQMFPVGCEARVQRLETMPDGRSTLLAFGRTRFRLLEVDTVSKPYLIGQVRWLDEPDGEPGLAEAIVPAVHDALLQYVGTLAELTGGTVDDETLPDEPNELSYLTAGAMLLALRERQALLELGDTATRLRAEVSLLRREQLLMAELRAVNAPELFRMPRSPN